MFAHYVFDTETNFDLYECFKVKWKWKTFPQFCRALPKTDIFSTTVICFAEVGQYTLKQYYYIENAIYIIASKKCPLLFSK